MFNKDTLRNLLAAAAVFLVIMALGPLCLPNLQPKNPPTTDAPTVSAASDPETAAPPSRAGSAPAPAPNPPVPAADGFTVVEDDQTTTVILGSDLASAPDKAAARSSPYRMRLTLSNVGAAVESATLTDHAASLGTNERYALLTPVESDGRTYRSLAVEKINLDDLDLPLHDKKWKVTRRDSYRTDAEQGEEVEFSIDVRTNGVDVIRLTRTFRLPRQSEEDRRHDLRSNLIVHNLSDAPHRVVVSYGAGLGIRATDAGVDDRLIDYGLRGSPTAPITGTRKPRNSLKGPAARATIYALSPANPSEKLSWAAVANTYFTCTVAPLSRLGGGEADYLAEVLALDADGSELTDADATVRFVTRAETLAPQAILSYPTDVFVGEKDGEAFKTVDAYKSRNYYFQVSQGFGYCTFSWLVELMVWLLNGICWATRDYGVAIIVLVLIVRTLLHPITVKGQVNMVRMQHRMAELAPKIEEIKKKFANDKVRMNQEMMKLNLNPAGQLFTCLPMLIQMPIWVALYLSLSHNIEMRHEPFLFTWIHDLTAQDALYTFASPVVVPLLGWHLPSFNLLPLLVAFTMYTQQKLQPKPKPNPNMTQEQRAQQETMQRMMPIMSIMMLFIFYKMPSGLNLYVMSSSLFGTIEQMRIRKHIKQREEAGTLHKTDRPADNKKNGRPSKSGLSFLERWQKIAADVQKSRKPRQRR